MALTRQQKKDTVADVSQNISEANSIVFMSYNALSLTDMNELRDQLYQQGCSMRVVPKRLLRLVMQEQGFEFDPTAEEGQIAAVWGKDAVAPAKVLYTFAKKQEQVRLLAGVLEGGVISLEQVTSLAQLPGREELLAKLVGSLAAPMSGMVGVLAGLPRQMIYVLQAIKDKKE